MLRPLVFALGGLVCAAVWVWGVLRFSEGAEVLGVAVITGAVLAGLALIGLYKRNIGAAVRGFFTEMFEGNWW